MEGINVNNLIRKTKANELNFLDNVLMVVRKNNTLSDLKEKFEQFFTDSTTADFMAKMFKPVKRKKITILDPGAGVGILSAALVINICSWKYKPSLIRVVLYEIDINLKEYLDKVVSYCNNICLKENIKFEYEIIQDDFIEQSIQNIKNNKINNFNYVIMNPPYKKINTDSKEKQMLLNIGIDCSNYYAAFVSLGKRYLKKNGQLVAITPRSFCNGTYFLEFRRDLFKDMRFEHIHLFHSRNSVFKEDDVLQENIIYNCIKSNIKKNGKILIYHSLDNNFSDLLNNKVNLNEILYPNDEEKEICEKMRKLPCALKDLKIEVSTGAIVDFRVEKNLLSKRVKKNSVPMIFSEHLSNGFINWPIKNAKKFNYIVVDKSNLSKLRENSNYVLVKRMVSKEEEKRIVASIYIGEKFNAKLVGFDNKINYYNFNKKGIDLKIARGLCVYLNSKFVDWYFRIISGSTQINANDLKNIRYPSLEQLKELSEHFTDILPEQKEIDKLVDNIVLNI